MILSYYRRRRLVAVAVAALVSGGVALQPIGGDPVHAVAAVLLVLVLPGAPVAITFMAFARPLERIALVLATSIVVTIFTVLLLNTVQIGLDSDAFALGLVGATLLSCILSALAPARGEPAIPRPAPGRSRFAVPLSVAAVLMVTAASLVAGISAQNRNDDDGFTQVWALQGEPAGFPTALIGVENQTGREQTYFARLKRDGKQFDTWGPFDLSPGDTVTETRSLDAEDGEFEVVVKSTDEDDPQQRTATLKFR